MRFDVYSSLQVAKVLHANRDPGSCTALFQVQALGLGVMEVKKAMPDGFRTRNRWGTFQEAIPIADDVFADPGSVVHARAMHYEFTEYSTGERLLNLRPIDRGQPRVLRAIRSQASGDDDFAVEHRFGFRRLIETFFDPVFKHNVELWELGDRSWAVRLHDLDSGVVSTLFEFDTGCTHRPF